MLVPSACVPARGAGISTDGGDARRWSGTLRCTKCHFEPAAFELWGPETESVCEHGSKWAWWRENRQKEVFHSRISARTAATHTHRQEISEPRHPSTIFVRMEVSREEDGGQHIWTFLLSDASSSPHTWSSSLWLDFTFHMVSPFSLCYLQWEISPYPGVWLKIKLQLYCSGP